MRRSARHASSILACVLLPAAACTSGGGNKSASTRTVQFQRGGTVHVGVQQWNKDSPFDPTTEFGGSALWQCCMLRTLYSYNGHPTAQGGSDLQPDLAAGPGEVSADGLTWTFHIKPGLRCRPLGLRGV
jgi:peptide/nickel transport system substrate-binding protein